MARERPSSKSPIRKPTPPTVIVSSGCETAGWSRIEAGERGVMDDFKHHRKSRSRQGNEADRRRVEAALWRVAKAEVLFAPKSASLRPRLRFLDSSWGRQSSGND